MFEYTPREGIMTEIILIVAPVAGLVLLGWSTARSGYLPPEAVAVLPAFAFKVTMPALIFRAFVTVEELPSAPESMIAVYFGAVAIVWILTSLVVVYVLRRPPPDAAPIAMASSFSNSVMLGLPLSIAAFGDAATIPAAIIIAIDTPLMWLAAVIHIELALNGRRGVKLEAVKPIMARLATNPIIVATLAGVIARLAGLQLDDLSRRFLDLLADAAVPTALLALGMSLSGFRMQGQTATLVAMTILKLAVFPIVVFALASLVITLPPVWFVVALLFAALPVGANPFLFAAQYDRAAGTLSASIAVTTVLSLFTITALLVYLKSVPGL